MKVRRLETGELVAAEVQRFTGERPYPAGVEPAPYQDRDELWFMEIDGPVTIKPGDWIFTYANGERWRKSANVFGEFYELVGDMEAM